MERDGASFPAEQHIVLPAEPASAARAREFVRGLLRRSHHQALEDAALLCVTELVSNVSLHTGSHQCTVTVVDETDDVLIRVTDDTPQIPNLTAPNPEAEYGRGLHIVNALAGEWGVRQEAGNGKSIWLRLCDQ